jgi:translation initiation factor eIF-2B subunit delta
MVLPPGLKKKVSRIREDNIHGAVDVARECCRLFRYNANASPERIKEIALALLEAQGSMATVVNLVNQVLFALDEQEDIRETVDHYLEHLTTSVDKIAEHSLKLIEKNDVIVTHSSGLTVRKTLLKAHEEGLEPKVICTESRPIFEGRKLAEELYKEGMDVTLVVDMAIFQEIERANLVLLGADSISIQGLVNKIGTKGVAQVARNLKKELFVLAGTDKILPLGVRPYSKDFRDSDEIFTCKSGMEVLNYYFDLTSMGLMDGLVTEDGVMDIYQLMDLIDRNEAHPLLKGNVKG